MMILKRFLAISILSSACMYAGACINEGTHNYYMFSVYDRELNGDNNLARINQNDYINRLNKNWDVYTNGLIKGYDSKKLHAYATQKKDAQMLNYIKQLDIYLKIASSYKETWNYPTRKQVLLRQQNLQKVRSAAIRGTKSRIRSQYALLYMRCNMLMKQYAVNVNFWNTTAKSMPNSVYRDMMMDIYAGSMAHTGKDDEACEIFAKLGDIPSISTWMMGKRNLKGIRTVYQHNQNAATLPFLVQEFVNNAQETVDDESADKSGGFNIYGKLFVKKVYRNEINSFCTFANSVVTDGKSKSPALWKTAAAWLHFMFGNRQTARQEIDEAMNLSGTERMKDNARAIRLYIYSATAKEGETFDNYLVKELDWLTGMARKEVFADNNYYPNHYTEVLDRLVNQQLVGKYDSWHHSEIATALAGVIRKQQTSLESTEYRYYDSTWNPEYSTDYFYRIDTLSADCVKCYLDYLQKVHEGSLDKWLLVHIDKNSNYLNDIIGTKYLAKGEYTKAIEYLEKVPLTFLDKQNIRQYMASRSFNTEKWFSRSINDNMVDNPETHITTNLKIKFAKAMNEMEAKYTVVNGEEKTKLAYEMANMYYQVSHLGNCWCVTHYSWSIGDSARVGEVDYVAKAINCLNIAKASTDFTLKEKALYALAYIPLQPWYEEVWDDASSKVTTRLLPNNRQYKALMDLSQFERRNHNVVKSGYITRCDVIRQFDKLINN